MGYLILGWLLKSQIGIPYFRLFHSVSDNIIHYLRLAPQVSAWLTHSDPIPDWLTSEPTTCLNASYSVSSIVSLGLPISYLHLLLVWVTQDSHYLLLVNKKKPYVDTIVGPSIGLRGCLI